MAENKVFGNELEDKEIEEELIENDEVSTAEAGFMEGYESKEFGECSNCKKSLDFEKAIVREIEGIEMTFCSRKCANLYGKRIH